MTKETSRPINSHVDKAHPDQAAEQCITERERVATLIGRLLARHWLRHNANLVSGGGGNGSNLNDTATTTIDASAASSRQP